MSRKQEEMKLKSSKVFLFGKRSPGTRCVKEPELLVRDEWMSASKMRRIHSTEAQEVKKGSGFDAFFAAMPSLSA